MSNQTFDAERFKRDQRETWNAAAAGWEKWWGIFEHAAQRVSDRLVVLARVKPGARVLDIATGTGEPAITAARIAGRSGHVIGIDQSIGMLAGARRRASALGLDNAEFREGDAESFAIAERDFDAVLCRWGLMFVPDLDLVARKIHGLLKESGWFATAVWASADKVPMISIASERVREIAKLPPPPPGTPDPLRLADTSILTRALDAAGFREMHQESIMVPFEFDSAQAFLECRADMSSAFRAMLSGKPPEIQRQIEQAVLAEARSYVGSDGRMRTENESILICAHR